MFTCTLTYLGIAISFDVVVVQLAAAESVTLCIKTSLRLGEKFEFDYLKTVALIFVTPLLEPWVRLEADDSLRERIELI